MMFATMFLMVRFALWDHYGPSPDYRTSPHRAASAVAGYTGYTQFLGWARENARGGLNFAAGPDEHKP